MSDHVCCAAPTLHAGCVRGPPLGQEKKLSTKSCGEELSAEERRESAVHVVDIRPIQTLNGLAFFSFV